MNTNRSRARENLPIGELGSRGRVSSSYQQQMREQSQFVERGGRGRGTSTHQNQKTENARGYDVGLQQTHQGEPSPMRGPRGGRGHGASGQGLGRHSIAPSVTSPVSVVSPSAIIPTSGRGQRPPMSRYGAYAAFTKQRDQFDPEKSVLEEVTWRLEEHKKETGAESQVSEVTGSTVVQRDLLQREEGGDGTDGQQTADVSGQSQLPSAESLLHASRCTECQFRMEFANLLRAIGALLKEFGNASSVGGGYSNGNA